MANDKWKAEEKKFFDALQNVAIPDGRLGEVDSIKVTSDADLAKISEGGGCYWIWTNEPVIHYLHRNPNPKPFSIDNIMGEVIYNGIAKDDVRGRIKHHLFGDVDAGWSGISMDIYFGETQSHRKKAFSAEGKVPYIKTTRVLKRSTKNGQKKGAEREEFKPIRTLEDFNSLFLSESEQALLKEANINKIFFRNGINCNEPKHKRFEFRVFFITGLNSLYLDYVEKKWREENGTPRLCSYKSGR